MSGHAILSPSAASRWLNCTPSARLVQDFPNKSSSFAEEGTLAHAVAELILRDPEPKEFNKQMAELAKSEYYSTELVEHAQSFADLVRSNMSKSSILLIEQRLDITSYIPEGFGTSDATIITGNVLKIFDLKYGKGVPVYADHNKQMMVYALGALNDFGFIYEIETVEMNIFQPRLDSHSMWAISVKDLIEWAETELKEKARMAYAGEGEFVAGKHCGFCPARAKCRALADYNMKLAAHDFQEPALLTDEEIADILSKKAGFVNWIDAVADYALHQALEEGAEFPGFKLVAGRSVRKYADPGEVAKQLQERGKTDIYAEPKLLGITEMTKRVGKAVFAEVVEPLLVKPEGKPVLVSVEDKRPPLKVSAADDFK